MVIEARVCSGNVVNKQHTRGWLRHYVKRPLEEPSEIEL